MDAKDEDTNASLLSGQTNGLKKSDKGEAEQTNCCSQRWTLAFMGVWLGVIAFMLNSSMNLAIVCMVKSNSDGVLHEHILNYNVNSSIKNGTIYIEKLDNLRNSSSGYSTRDEYKPDVNTTISYFEPENSCHTTSNSRNKYSEHAEFSWDKKTQSIVLSSYYYGYLVIQIPGGWLATKFGGRRVIGTCMILSSALTILMPVFARASVYLVIVARAILGLCIGTSTPSICGLIGTWALPNERSRILGMCWLGQNIGAILGFSTSGLLCVHGFDNGWASIFYIQGMVTLIFVCSWWYVIYNTPQEHPRISEAERRLIEKHMPPNINTKSVEKKNEVPWRSILTYFPVYVVYINHICDTWTFYLLVTCLPLFLKEVLKFDIESNGIFSCLPYISYMAGIIFAGVCADLIRSWKNFTITTIRKVFQLASCIGVAVFILIPGYLTCEYRYGVIACLCLCTFFEAVGVTGGHIPNIIDIAPRYSSVIFGISNTIATIPGIIAPIAVGAITKTGTSEEWRIVFFIAAGVSLFAAVMYGCFANSELAPWATDIEDQLEIEVKISNDSIQNGLVVTTTKHE